VEQLSRPFPQAGAMLAEASEEVLAFASFPKEHWRQLWSNNPRSGSTGRSATAPMWWASSPTGKP
jgi:hypothetical protein